MEQNTEGIPAEQKPIVTPKSQNTFRRRLANTLGAGILGLTLTGSGSAPIPAQKTEGYPTHPSPTQPVETSPLPEQNPVETIRQFIETQGDRELTFDEAKGLTPHLAKLFGSLDTRLSAQEISNKIFILDFELTEEDRKYAKEIGFNLDDNNLDSFNVPFFKRIREGYPDIKPGVDIKNSTIFLIYKELSRWEGKIFGLTDKESVLIFLNSTNNSGDNLSFKSFSDKVCEPATPTGLFISTTLHELGHQDELQGEKPINQTILKELLAKDNIHDDTKISGVNDGFWIRLDLGEYESMQLWGLDEFVIQHIANKLTVDNGLPAVSVGPNAPKDSSNFQLILDQAGISTEELLRLHRGKQLEAFLIKVAEGANGVEFNSEEEKLKFGTQLFTPLFDAKIGWEIPFKQYFNKIDLRGYPDKPYYSDKRPFPGCGVPDLRSSQK